jgi:hypothetical protein
MRLRTLVAVLLLVALLSGCSAPLPTPAVVPTYTPAPTYTPYPTLTPLPAYTPQATLTPYPTDTPMPTLTPAPTLTLVPAPTPTPTRPPAPTVAPPTATPVRWLDVEFNTVQYSCQRRCIADRGDNWDPGHWAYAYRTFHVNLRVANLTKDKTLAAPWGPYFIVTDGVSEWKRTDYWYWLLDAGGSSWWAGGGSTAFALTGPQPDVPPGGTVNFTFTHFIPRPGMWVKAVGIEALGQTYTQALDLADAKANANYIDCGEVFSHACPGGQLPPIPY